MKNTINILDREDGDLWEALYKAMYKKMSITEQTDQNARSIIATAANHMMNVFFELTDELGIRLKKA